MACFTAKAERERTELREMLELSNAQREEARKAADAAGRRADDLGRQLAAKNAEAGGLAAQLRDAGGREARLAAANDALAGQTAGLQRALERAGAARDELGERVAELSAERKQAQADVRRLTKDREYLKHRTANREYLKHRVDRMQKALSMLESVLDDTLRENQGLGAAAIGAAGGAGAGAAGAAGSREVMSDTWGRGADASAPGALGGGGAAAGGGKADGAKEQQRGLYNGGAAAYAYT
ncbi:MAG: hypothetical protein J3K34DRAFT_522625 [Monoraphidium minutum]|nr:MAG: hypothetical protein J3K34DRAFT_522625 [Monoraphidium minutum]